MMHYICRGVHLHKDQFQALNKAVHIDCFDVFVIVLVTVIF